MSGQTCTVCGVEDLILIEDQLYRKSGANYAPHKCNLAKLLRDENRRYRWLVEVPGEGEQWTKAYVDPRPDNALRHVARGVLRKRDPFTYYPLDSEVKELADVIKIIKAQQCVFDWKDI